ncbi:hypothetical protein PHLCEN_2v7051 [Hermanssonia centrifuga]|uniref:Uncharacterized protein n=1 Tax=Hermanssonia centrifuga TaxID=98765 RepID=A0A2R6NXQ8_9APHY|nr:hypothetical protein PHLCEN_2v7051 [Hermanssonia centrifuga]
MSNQALSPAEDAENKPFRPIPIPAGLITVEETKTIRWVFLPICLAVSVYYDVLPTGLVFALGTIAYNEMKLDSHWFSKNILNALLYGAFDAGAIAIASHGLGK